MRAEKLDSSVIAAFKHSYGELVKGASGSISEGSIAPVESLPSLEQDILSTVLPDPNLLKVVLLNRLLFIYCRAGSCGC